MYRAILAGIWYFIPVMAAAFVMGVVRVTLLVPALGSQLAAVALEVPLILFVSWQMAGVVLRRFGPLAQRQTWLVGATAFMLLIASELLLARLLAGQSPSAWLASLGTPAGLLGLTGQILFACVPAIRNSRSTPVHPNRN